MGWFDKAKELAKKLFMGKYELNSYYQGFDHGYNEKEAYCSSVEPQSVQDAYKQGYAAGKAQRESE